MILTTEFGDPTRPSDGYELADVLRTLDPNASSFAALTQDEDEMSYMQVYCADGDLYVVEIQRGSLSEHYELPEPVSFADMNRLLARYLNGDDALADQPWQKMDL